MNLLNYFIKSICLGKRGENYYENNIRNNKE